ncbi:hypothetical protein ACWDBD_15540 [Streptomyces sp. NPDC001118]
MHWPSHVLGVRLVGALVVALVVASAVVVHAWALCGGPVRRCTARR